MATRSEILKKYDPRSYKTPLYIQLKEVTEDPDYGYTKGDWDTLKCADGTKRFIMAKVETPKGRQVEFARQQGIVGTVRIETRYNQLSNSLTCQRHRLVNTHTGDIYEIEFTDNVLQANRFILIYGKTFKRSGLNCNPPPEDITLEVCQPKDCSGPKEGYEHNPIIEEPVPPPKPIHQCDNPYYD